MHRSSLLGHYDVPPPHTLPPVYVTASAGPSGKSWYTTTQRWFSANRPPLGTSNHVQLPPLQPLHVPVKNTAKPSGRVSRSSSIHGFSPQPAPMFQYGTHYSEMPFVGYYVPAPRPAPNPVPMLVQRDQASAAAPFRARHPLKRPREDNEDILSALHDTRRPGPSSLPSTLPPTSDILTAPARKRPRCADVVAVHSGCALSTSDIKTDDARSMPSFTTLRQPPTRVESMASITHFALDSARALRTIKDLATRREAFADSCLAPSAPISRASSSCCSSEDLPSPAESALRSPRAAPAMTGTAPQLVSPLSEQNRSGSPTGRGALSESPNPSASPESSDYPTLGTTQRLRYVVTTPAEVQASISSPDVGLSSSLFYAGGTPLYRDRVELSSSSKAKRLAPESIREEEQHAKKPRISSRPRPTPTPEKPQPPSARRDKKEATEAVCPQPDSDEFKDDRPPKESVAQLAVGSGTTYKMSKMKCLWPDCAFCDYPGELWFHIKDVHRADAGRPKPSGNPVVVCNWAPPGEPRGNRCTYRERASRMWEHFMSGHHKESVKPGGEIMCRLGQCTARSKNLDFQRHLEDVHWKLEGTVRWCEGCGVWKRFDKGRLMHHFQNCLRKWMDCDPGFRQGLEVHEIM